MRSNLVAKCRQRNLNSLRNLTALLCAALVVASCSRRDRVIRWTSEDAKTESDAAQDGKTTPDTSSDSESDKEDEGIEAKNKLNTDAVFKKLAVMHKELDERGLIVALGYVNDNPNKPSVNFAVRDEGKHPMQRLDVVYEMATLKKVLAYVEEVETLVNGIAGKKIDLSEKQVSTIQIHRHRAEFLKSTVKPQTKIDEITTTSVGKTCAKFNTDVNKALALYKSPLAQSTALNENLEELLVKDAEVLAMIESYKDHDDFSGNGCYAHFKIKGDAVENNNLEALALQNLISARDKVRSENLAAAINNASENCNKLSESLMLLEQALIESENYQDIKNGVESYREDNSSALALVYTCIHPEIVYTPDLRFAKLLNNDRSEEPKIRDYDLDVREERIRNHVAIQLGLEQEEIKGQIVEELGGEESLLKAGNYIVFLSNLPSSGPYLPTTPTKASVREKTSSSTPFESEDYDAAADYAQSLGAFRAQEEDELDKTTKMISIYSDEVESQFSSQCKPSETLKGMYQYQVGEQVVLVPSQRNCHLIVGLQAIRSRNQAHFENLSEEVKKVANNEDYLQYKASDLTNLVSARDLKENNRNATTGKLKESHVEDDIASLRLKVVDVKIAKKGQLAAETVPVVSEIEVMHYVISEPYKKSGSNALGVDIAYETDPETIKLLSID